MVRDNRHMEERIMFLRASWTLGFAPRTDQIRCVEMPSPTAWQTHLKAGSAANDIS
jgi:hypothetical protein